MSSRADSASFIPRTYAELRRSVQATLLTGQRNIEHAKVRTYWETGRLIREHVLLFEQRADYGAGTIQQLAADLNVHRSTLQRCVQFAEAIQNCATWRNLTWAHYRVLIPIADASQRRAFAAEANRGEWTVAQLEARVRALHAAAKEPPDANGANGSSPVAPLPRLLNPKCGTPDLHLIVDRGGETAVDLGFKLYRPLPPEASRRFAKGDIVQVDGDGLLHRASDATKADLFTYRATVRRVIDGDTLVVAMEVAPGIWLEEKLRLRGLDCPELGTAEGRAARRFVDRLLAPGGDITITTTKPDKYDRYLADVFVGAADPVSSSPTSGPQLDGGNADIFLNNALLEHGHAMRKDDWSIQDWEKDQLA